MPTSSNSNNPSQTNDNIIRLLQDLNDKMGLMVDVIEKQPRAGVPNSMYFNIERGGFKTISGADKPHLTKYSELSEPERKSVVEEYADEINASNSRAARGIKNIRAMLESGEKDGVEMDRAERRRMRAKLKSAEDAFVREKHNQKVEENLQKLKEAGYKNKKAYLDHEAEQAEYRERTLNRRDSSSKIAHSGLGNTMLGRGAQNLINTRQRADDIVNFGFDLKNGGANNIATSLFGNGAVAKGATKALGGFGSALTKLGGPIAGLSYGFKLGWAAVEKFADIVNKANAYILRVIKQQTNLDRLAYEKNAQLASLQNDLDVERIKYFGDLQLKQIEIQSENLKRAVEIATSRFVKATEIAVGPLTDGINETAYKAAEANIETTADVLKFQKEMELRTGQYGLFEKRRSTEFKNYADVNIAEAEKTKAKYRQDAALSTFNTLMEQEKDWAGELAYWGRDKVGAISEGERKIEEETSQSHELPNGQSDSMSKVIQDNLEVMSKAGNIYTNRLWGTGYDKATGVVEQELQNKVMLPAEWEKQQADMYSKISNTVAGIQEQVGQKQIEAATEVAKTYIDAAAEMKKTWLQLAKKTENWVEEFDTMTNDLGINFGYTTKEQLKSYQESLFGILENTVSKFGKDREDMVKMQQGYIESTGRQKLLNESDYGQLFGLGKYLGDDGLAAQFASGMEIFNAGAAESVDLLDKTLQDVNRIGLNGRKYTKEVVNNLKLAQKYNFKGGTKGFMEMAKWAEKTRFNLASLGGMLDKVQEGGLEGVIKQSAEFQVLGGHAAMNSDPFGMMFDAWADPDAFAKRMQGMTKGFGTVDKKTGETKFNINESMQLAQIAKIQGRSVEELRGEVMDRNRREAVMNSLSSAQKSSMSQEELDMLGSSAQYNRNTGQFEVNLKQADGTYKATAVSDIQKSDIQNLMPEKHEERMEVYMQDVLSAIQGVKSEEVAERANAAAATYETIMNEYAERTRVAHEAYAQNRDKYIAEIIAGSKLATSSFQDFIGVFNQGNSDLSSAEEDIKAQTDRISEALSGVADVVNEAVSKIREEVVVDRMGMKSSLDDETGRYVYKKKEKQYVFGNGTSGSANFNDGIVSGDGDPMIVEAQHVVPINDGVLGVTKGTDTMLAKEPGGIVDDWMNGLGSKITDMHNDVVFERRKQYEPNRHATNAAIEKMLNDLEHIAYGVNKKLGAYDKRTGETRFTIKDSMQIAQIAKNEGRSIEEVRNEIVQKNKAKYEQNGKNAMPDSLKIMHDSWSDPYEYAHRQEALNRPFDNTRTNQKRDVNVNINGRLMLDGGGQQIDLLQILRSNPDLVRKITEVVINQMSSNENGGKYEMFSNRYYR